MLYQKILNKLDEERGLSDELAVLAGYKSGQALRKALRENREFGSFQGLVCLVQELFPNDEIKLLSDYAKEVDPNKQTARCLLEYAEINNLNDLRVELVEKMKNCSNAVSIQWAEIHKIDIDYIEGKINYHEALNSLGKINIKSDELDTLRVIYKTYCYLDEQLYDIVIDLLDSVSIKEDEIKDSFINTVIAGRYYLLLSECYTRKGEIEKSRIFSNKLINEINYKVYIAWGNLHLGNSYIFTDYDKSNKFMMTGMFLSSNLPQTIIKNLERSMNFLDNVWKKNPRFLDLNSNYTSDFHEVIFNHINQKRMEEAKSLLESQNLDKLSINQKGFHFYLKGLVTNSISDFCESVKNFKMSGDYYYRRLPLLELKRLNLDDCIIEVMAA